KLVNQATSIGTQNPGRFAELGCAAFAEEAGAVIDPFDNVIWWQLAPSAMPRPGPWTRSETHQLAKAGVRVQALDVRLRAATRAWVRPVLAASKQLTMVLPPGAEEIHPVWQMIRQVLPDAPVTELESQLVAPDG